MPVTFGAVDLADTAESARAGNAAGLGVDGEGRNDEQQQKIIHFETLTVVMKLIVFTSCLCGYWVDHLNRPLEIL